MKQWNITKSQITNDIISKTTMQQTVIATANWLAMRNVSNITYWDMPIGTIPNEYAFNWIGEKRRIPKQNKTKQTIML